MLGFDLQNCTAFSPSGTDMEAELLATAEFTRIAQELERDDSSSDSQKADKVFTAYLYPAVYDVRTLAQDLIPLNFPWDDPDVLSQVMPQEVETLYATGGMDRAESLLPSIAISGRFHIGVPGGPGSLPGDLFPNAVAFESSEEAMKAGNLVWISCEDALRALRKRAAATVKTVQDRAAAIAGDRLGKASYEIASEAPKYLSLLGRRVAGADLLEAGAKESEILLRGPDLAALVGALREIHSRRRALDAAADDLASKRALVLSEMVLQLGVAGLSSPTLAHPDVDSALASAFPETVAALQSATNDLALALTVHCRSFPILFRIWNGPELPAEVVAKTSPSGDVELVARTYAGGTAIEQFKHRLFATLQEAWDANRTFSAKIDADSSLTWRYPPTIALALDSLGIPSPSVEFRAVQERMEQEHGTPIAAKLGMVVGALDLGAALAGAAPPVGVVLACTMLTLGAYDRVREFLANREQEAASKAALDPSNAVASPPDYLGFVAGLAFCLLDLRAVHSALAAARFAGQVSMAKVAVEVAVP